MISIQNTECCGVKFMSGVSRTSPKEAIKTVAQEFINDFSCDQYGYIEQSAFILFADILRAPSSRRGGAVLAKFIKDNKLGSLIKSRPKINDNTGNFVIVWTWAYNLTNIKKWYKKNYV